MYIPWRLRNYLSESFPLLYHLAVNIGFNGNSQDYWDARLAETWDDRGRDWPDKNRLMESLINSDDTVLDVACGNGSILRYLKQRGYDNLHGLEISQYAIQRLAEEGISMHYGKLPALALPDASYDVVIASQVLEHIIRRHHFVREIARILKPNGRVMIFVPDNCLGPIDESEHVIKYTEDSLQKFLSKYFDIIDLRSIRDSNHTSPVLFAYAKKRKS